MTSAFPVGSSRARWPRAILLLLLLALVAPGSPLRGQNGDPEQVLAAMDKSREQVISRLSLSEKMKMKNAIGAIQDNPGFVAANDAVAKAPTPEARIEARKALATLKLDLIVRQDPSLKPVVEKIRLAQASVLQ